jgi:hypothetical protein
MIIKRLFIICSLPSFLAGCAEFYGSQPPAPVYGSGSTIYNKTTPSLPKPKAPKAIASEPMGQGSTGIVKTKPLKEYVPITTPLEELESEPLTPEQEPQGQESLAPEQEYSPPEQELATQEPVISAPEHSGNIESATTTIERAIRIEPRNATLYYKLALLRLKQSKPHLAEDLAKKAALLASNDTQLKKHSWLLVARAREMQGDLKGGKEARAKANRF